MNAGGKKARSGGAVMQRQMLLGIKERAQAAGQVR